MNDVSQTNRPISTRLTLPLKTVGILLLVSVALWVLLLLRYGDTPLLLAIAGAVPVFVVVSWVCWLLLSLSHVVAHEDGIEARKFGITTEVRFSDITHVTSYHALAAGIGETKGSGVFMVCTVEPRTFRHSSSFSPFC